MKNLILEDEDKEIIGNLFFNENKELHPGFYIGMGLILLTVIIQVVRIIYQHKKEIIPN